MQRGLLRGPLAVVLVVALLAGCTTTRVHFFTDGLSDATVSRVTTELERSGYEVRLNAAAPPAVTQPTIIYNPASASVEAVELLDGVLKNLGYRELHYAVATTGNHSYTPGNIGLYLNTRSGQGTSMLPPLQGVEYTGRCDGADAYLTLQNDGRFAVEIFSWNDDQSERTVTGRWRHAAPSLYLEFNDTHFQYEIDHFEREVEGLTSRGIALRKASEPGAFADCWFVYQVVVE